MTGNGMETQIEAFNGDISAIQDLLLLADPSLDVVDKYIKNSSVLVLKTQGQIIGVVVLQPHKKHGLEIMNLAVSPVYQGKGLGRLLLRYSCEFARARNLPSIAIATANSSIGQLRLYQQEGFDMHEIRRNFFLETYQEPIFENGIQARHSILLVKRLTVEREGERR